MDTSPSPGASSPVIIRKDRKSTRLNSSHEWSSYAVFCSKKKRRDVAVDAAVLHRFGPPLLAVLAAATALVRRAPLALQVVPEGAGFALFFQMIGARPRSTRFPYTTLCR